MFERPEAVRSHGPFWVGAAPAGGSGWARRGGFAIGGGAADPSAAPDPIEFIAAGPLEDRLLTISRAGKLHIHRWFPLKPNGSGRPFTFTLSSTPQLTLPEASEAARLNASALLNASTLGPGGARCDGAAAAGGGAGGLAGAAGVAEARSPDEPDEPDEPQAGVAEAASAVVPPLMVDVPADPAVDSSGSSGSSVVGPSYAVSADGRWLLSGGHWDGSLRCTSLLPGVDVSVHAQQHAGVITCLSVGADGHTVVTGSADCTLVVWNLYRTPGGGASGGSAVPSASPCPVHVLSAHASPVLCAALSTQLDLVLSGATVTSPLSPGNGNRYRYRATVTVPPSPAEAASDGGGGRGGRRARSGSRYKRGGGADSDGGGGGGARELCAMWCADDL